MKMNETEKNLEQLEEVNGGSFIDDIVEKAKEVKDAIEKEIRKIPRVNDADKQ